MLKNIIIYESNYFSLDLEMLIKLEIFILRFYLMDLSELLKLQKKVSTRAGKKRSHLKKN